MAASTGSLAKTSPTIVIGNPLEHAAEIKQLFLAHDRPEFPDFFDRTYPAAVSSGATCWLGRTENGRLIMYQACFPRRFRFRQRDVRAGLMMNLLVATEYRSFFPALGLVKRVVQDLESRGDLDFLYADPNEPSRVLLQAAGFTKVGTLGRYVLPVADRHLLIDLGVRLFHALLRARHGGATGLVAVPQAASRFAVESVAAPHLMSQRVTAYHDLALYVSRLPGYPADRHWWLTFSRPGSSGPPDGALLIEGPDDSGLALLRTVRCAPGLGPAAVLPALIAELRRRRCTRLHVATLVESAFGRAFPRAGFLRRRDKTAILALALTPEGEACVGSKRDWEITDLECDR